MLLTNKEDKLFFDVFDRTSVFRPWLARADGNGRTAHTLATVTAARVWTPIANRTRQQRSFAPGGLGRDSKRNDQDMAMRVSRRVGRTEF